VGTYKNLSHNGFTRFSYSKILLALHLKHSNFWTSADVNNGLIVKQCNVRSGKPN